MGEMKVRTLIIGKMKVCTLIMGKMKVRTYFYVAKNFLDISGFLLLLGGYVASTPVGAV